MISSLAAVAAGGAIGASLRWLTGLGAVKLFGHGWPYGTFTANLVGALVMGFLIHAFALRGGMSKDMTLFLTTGLLGGYTTFSTYALDIVTMANRGKALEAALYAGLSVAGGVLMILAGMRLARLITG